MAENLTLRVKVARSLTDILSCGITKSMHYQSNMTIKGQVTVPKDIREALGLEPGDAVEFELDADGNARIFNAASSDRVSARKADFLNRLREVQAEFKHLDTMPDSGMDGAGYQRWLRGDEFGE